MNEFVRMAQEVKRLQRELKTFEVPAHYRDALRLQEEIRRLQEQAQLVNRAPVPDPVLERLEQLERRVQRLERQQGKPRTGPRS